MIGEEQEEEGTWKVKVRRWIRVGVVVASFAIAIVGIETVVETETIAAVAGCIKGDVGVGMDDGDDSFGGWGWGSLWRLWQ
jgi:hypothetical protein